MDLEKVKRRLNQLQTSTQRTSNLWKPQPGKQVVRIVPYQHNKDNPFQELFFHYDLGGKTYLSPITFGRPDPIEEFASEDHEHVHDGAGMLHPLRCCTGMFFCISDVVQDGAGMLHLHSCYC